MFKKFLKKIFNKVKKDDNIKPEDISEYYKLYDKCNRIFMYMILPNMIKVYKDPDKLFKVENFYSKEYYKNFLTNTFGEKVLPFCKDIKIEKANIAKSSNLDIYILNVPNSGEIGQIECCVIIFDYNSNDIKVFHMECSLNKTFCLCEWDSIEKRHYNYGVVNNKKNFVLKILELLNEDEKDKVSENNKSQSTEELDVKHRLAKEIGIRFEMLDFYMSKFQEMIKMEMNGLDSSIIYSDIEDLEEWSRYCQWEVEQAKSRISKDDLEKSKVLFDMMIEREKIKKNIKWN